MACIGRGGEQYDRGTMIVQVRQNVMVLEQHERNRRLTRCSIPVLRIAAVGVVCDRREELRAARDRGE